MNYMKKCKVELVTKVHLLNKI